MTILAFVAFLGVVYWAFSTKRKADFDAAARLPLEDDQPTPAAMTAAKIEEPSR